MAAHMTSYEERELRAAHARINELEGLIAGRAPAPVVARSGRRILSHVAFALTLVLFACAVTWLVVPKREIVVQAAPAAPAPGIPAGVLSWQVGPVFHERGVSLVDVDGDGAKDIVGLAWRHGDDALPLHVVAFDRKTYAVRWRAGPFPAAWRDKLVHLDVSGVGIVVSDGAGMSHVLDRRTGVEVAASYRSPKGDPWADELQRPKPCVDGTTTCTPPTPEAVEEKLGAFFHTAHVYPHDFLSGDDRITVATVSPAQGPPHAALYAVRWDADAKKVLWSVPLVPPPQQDKRDASSSPDEWTALAKGRLFHLYQHENGDFRINGRDAKSGALLYDLAVPVLGDGSSIGALTADGDEAFIVANESLIVIDGKTGDVAQRLRRF